jgi:DNA invertase Pin-like site-specific DNA recombinase
MISDKLRPHHLERKALLYVRQSSAHQVLHNRESSALQYAMCDRLTALGWSEIEVIDDDLGRSAAGGVQRAGFERMVAQQLSMELISARTVLMSSLVTRWGSPCNG